MIDLHTHLWPHEPGTQLPTYDDLARRCEYAQSVGVQQIAITEHCNRFEEVADIALPIWERKDAPSLTHAADHVWAAERGAHLDEYVQLLTTAQQRGLPLLVGLEVDHLPGANEAIAQLLQPYPFDLLLGSVHWLGSWLFDAYGTAAFADEWERRDVDDVWTAYIDAITALAGSGFVDVIAHLDVIKVTGNRPHNLAEHEARLVAALASTDVAVEVSSAGLRKPAAEMYPSPTLLAALHANGVPLTTASDAHRTDQIGDHFDDLRAQLQRAGVDTLATFRRRERQRTRLNP